MGPDLHFSQSLIFCQMCRSDPFVSFDLSFMVLKYSFHHMKITRVVYPGAPILR